MAPEIKDFDSKLLYLIQKKKKKQVESIIADKNLYDVTDCYNYTLLHMAALYDNASLAKYLINSGSKVDVQNDRGETPLMLAIANDFMKIVAFLLEAGASVIMQDNDGNSALSMINVCVGVSNRILMLFLQNLQSVCSGVKEEIAKKLSDAKWSLHKIVQLHDADLTKIMLDRGHADIIDALDRHRQTALHICVRSVDVENVKLLLEYDANVNTIDYDDETPLSIVFDGKAHYSDKNRLIILKMLLNRGAVLISDDRKPKNFDVFEYGSIEAIKLLLKTDFDLSITASDSNTVVHALMANKNLDAFETLRGKCFDVNARNCDLVTPLIIAARHGNVDAVEFLLDRGADVNAVDINNSSAVFGAIDSYYRCKDRYQECMLALLERGANVQLKVRYHGESTVIEMITSRTYLLLGELMVGYLALQETLGTRITRLTRSQMYVLDRLEIYELCKQKLSMVIDQSITLLDLLTATDLKLERYVRNEELLPKIQDAVKTLFDYYYFMCVLKKRMAKAIRIVALKKEAARVVCRIMQTSYESFPVIVDKMVNYLEQRDMENLVKATLQEQ